MKIVVLTGCFLVLHTFIIAQTPQALTIEGVYEMAMQHYPQVQKRKLISKSKDYSIQNAFRGYYPQIHIQGQTTYQSEVTQIPVELPNVHIEPPPKDQYKIYAEINQNLYNGGRVNKQIQMEKADAVVKEQQLQVELYQIKERLNQLFFGILLVDRQVEQTALTKKEVEIGIEKIKAAIENGTALHSSLLLLEAELLRINQRNIEFKATRQAYGDMLGLFIKLPIDEKTVLMMPGDEKIQETIKRPELKLFDFQQEKLEVRKSFLRASLQPQIDLFFQGGYGRPGLNMLSSEFGPYYIGGIRFNWSLANFYTFNNERELLALDRQMIKVEEENFIFNISLSLRQQRAEIKKLQDLLKADKEILALREEILTTATAQLEYGAITTNDYLTEVIAEDKARQNLLLHQVQLLMAKYHYNIIAGN